MSTPSITVMDLTGDDPGTGESAIDRARLGLRALVQARADGADGRAWAVLGEFPDPSSPDPSSPDPSAGDNERAVAHDRVGRQAVRLAVDVMLAVGETRIVRALHQGAVMEGSWGDEARLLPDAAAAVEMLLDEVADGDVVLVAGGDLSVVTRALLDDERYTATLASPVP